MFKKILENEGIIIKNNVEFVEIMKATTQDIKFNNIGFKKRTSLTEVINIALTTAETLKRCG